MPKPRVWTEDKLDEVAEALDAWLDRSIKSQKEFLIGDFCFKSDLGFLPSYFYKYRAYSVKLDDAYNRAKEWQAHCISKGILYNKLNQKFGSHWLNIFHKELGWEITDNLTIETTAEQILNLVKPSKDLVGQKVDECKTEYREVTAEIIENPQ
jgi:hypothetical protein